MSKFKVGDKVKTTEGTTGTIISVNRPLGHAVMECDNPANGVKITQFPNKNVLWLPESDFKRIKADRYEFHITSDGDTTHAVYKVNGKIESRGEAKRNPSDTYDFKTGAELAMKRALGIEDKWEETAKVEQKFKVGDRVKLASVRPATWNFNGKMDKYLGNVVTITKIYNGNFFEFEGSEHWCFNLRDVEPYTEPAQPEEPTKLYCVKDYKSGKYLTKGNLYVFENGGFNNFDDGRPRHNQYNTFDEFAKPNPEFMRCLVPLVSRPAKVGEWVMTITENPGYYKKGDVSEVERVDDDDTVYLKKTSVRNGAWISSGKYLVLDGHKPEPEYYNGKVVCVKWDGDCFTPGKVYEIIDGRMKTNIGAYSTPIFKTIDDVLTYGGKFIEYKGDSNA